MKTVRILIVDDEEQFRQSTSKVLKRRGFEIFEAENGQKALETLSTSPVDIVLLDYKMEGMDGIAVLKEIRKVQPELPVIILTGHGGYDVAMAGFDVGITDFLQKPVDIDYLTMKITSVIDKKIIPLMKEKTITDIMIPIRIYKKISADTTVKEAIKMLGEGFLKPEMGKVFESGHRSVLIYDGDKFLGMLRITDILRGMEPDFLRKSEYASFYTGMLLAHSKVEADQPIRNLMKPLVTIQINAPLMEALNIINREHLINLPVISGGKLVGVVRDIDLFIEISRLMVE
ncbi:MAG: response regulator [bacterium]